MAINRIGFACSGVAAALDNTWDGVANAPIPLTVQAADGRSMAFPPACLLGTLDLDIDTVAGALTIQAMLTWDALGTKVIAGPTSTSTMWAGAGVPAGRSGASFHLLDRPTSPPASVAAGIKPFPAADPGTGTVYLWLRLDAGTANLSANGARLNWRIPENG